MHRARQLLLRTDFNIKPSAMASHNSSADQLPMRELILVWFHEGVLADKIADAFKQVTGGENVAVCKR